uniref:Phospholipase A2 inhibitor and Ly6/PLAUR domain-containing protein-like isoform X2 n=1 Tax=Geotrypetes seraphini TaxID=260995 RepID=A0A6P8SHW4_GEOSA|nr:phospholipase A2 inhibitor and Ly6/PLAUR domain-containing protein-like isoform X2 [Geotrypetes seraphini]
MDGAGTSLTCTMCMSLNGANCVSTENETCKSTVTTCETVMLEFKIKENVTTALVRSCTRFPFDCKVPYRSFSGETFSFMFQVKCCDSDNCNTDVLSFPPRNSTKNGVQCPVCPVAVDATQCHSNGRNMECTGEETQCLFFAGKMLHPAGKFLQLAFRGCVHSDTCKEKIPPYPESRLEEGSTFQCSPGTT